MRSLRSHQSSILAREEYPEGIPQIRQFNRHSGSNGLASAFNAASGMSRGGDGYDKIIRSERSTPLHEAVKTGRHEIVEALLKEEVQPIVESKPLELVAKEEETPVAAVVAEPEATEAPATAAGGRELPENLKKYVNLG